MPLHIKQYYVVRRKVPNVHIGSIGLNKCKGLFKIECFKITDDRFATIYNLYQTNARDREWFIPFTLGGQSKIGTSNMQLSLISGLSKREIKDNFSLFARMLLVSIVARSRCSTPVCTQQQDQAFIGVPTHVYRL